MMSEPPKAKDGDQMCPICNKEISKHNVSEMLSCSRKIQESENEKTENDEMRWIKKLTLENNRSSVKIHKKDLF